MAGVVDFLCVFVSFRSPRVIVLDVFTLMGVIVNKGELNVLIVR